MTETESSIFNLFSKKGEGAPWFLVAAPTCYKNYYIVYFKTIMSTVD